MAPNPYLSARQRMSDKQMAFIEWLCTPEALRNPQRQKDWCTENHVTFGKPAEWRNDPDFKLVWSRRMTELQVTPDRLAEILDSLHDQGVKGNHQAAKLWISTVQAFMPKVNPVEEAPSATALADLSDDELEALVRDAATAELERRTP